MARKWTSPLMGSTSKSTGPSAPTMKSEMFDTRWSPSSVATLIHFLPKSAKNRRFRYGAG